MVAFVIPGFVALWGASQVSMPIRVWMFGADLAGPNVGSVLYVTLASLGAGMAAGAVRWALIDTLHHLTGVQRPKLDFRKLEERLAAFYAVVDNHYRFYQFYANTLVASAFAYFVYRFGPQGPGRLGAWPDAAFLLVVLVFGAASRDALRRYYVRAEELLGSVERVVTHDKRIRSRRLRGRDEEREGSEDRPGQGSPPEGGEAGGGPEPPGGEK
jgi:hypothetical protein